MGCEKIGYGGLFQQVSSVNATDITNNLMKLPSGIETFRSSGWAPVVSSNPDGSFFATTSGFDQFANLNLPCVLKGQTISCPSGEVFSDMMHSLEQNSGFHQSFCSNQGTNACQVSDNGAHGSSSAKGKRKSSEDMQLGDSTMEVVDDRENCSGLISQGKKVKDNKLAAGKAKENYVHVRAKRGQATNSHSLAERVRREKISERMKMLQDLVPGCKKITGKAVMLDEIINYVQSLQQQVEFLSMKLATVNSELNMDSELPRILPNEFFHLQSNDTAILGAHPELRFIQTLQGTTNVTINGFSGTNTLNPWNMNSKVSPAQDLTLINLSRV